MSAVVARALDAFAEGELEVEERRRRLDQLRAKTPAFAAGRRAPREQLYERRGRRR